MMVRLFRYFPFSCTVILFLLVRPVFAAGVEVISSAAASQPLVSDRQLDYLIFIGGSAVVAGLNALLRSQKRKGKKSGPVVLFLLAIANSIVGNFDQTARQAKAGAGKVPDGGSGRDGYDVANDGKP